MAPMSYDRLDVPMYSDDQSPKDCKKQTPDFQDANPKKGKVQVGYKVKDRVHVMGKSLVNGVQLQGEYTFDSYDKYDNTCYVVGKGSMTYNVLLTDISLITEPKKI